MTRRSAALALTLVLACASPPAPGARISLWHTFGPGETAWLARDLATLGMNVDATLVPFGMARSRLGHALERGQGCPDLARVDATWLPLWIAEDRLLPVPDALHDFMPEAIELVSRDGVAYGVPQTVDGLAIIYEPATVAGIAWPPKDLAALDAAARALTRDGRYGLSLRSDGYWFVAWLRAAGGDVLDHEKGTLGVDRPEAVAALASYAQLAADHIAPPPAPAADEAALEAERFAAGEVALVVGGPWTVAALENAAARRGRRLDLAVAPFPLAADGRAGAPRGGQVFVVPRCAAHPQEAFRLAFALTAAERQASWSQELGVVPTRKAALAAGSPLARAFATALSSTRPLPRQPLTPLLFDDLTPAVQAVMAGDATAEEALVGVARGWRRLEEKAR